MYQFTINLEDLKPRMTRRATLLRKAIGKILPVDIGKRVYTTDGHSYQVENASQRDARMGRRRL